MRRLRTAVPVPAPPRPLPPEVAAGQTLVYMKDAARPGKVLACQLDDGGDLVTRFAVVGTTRPGRREVTHEA